MMIEIAKEDRTAAEREVHELAQRDDKILVGAELGPFIEIAAERNALRRMCSLQSSLATKGGNG